MTSNNTSIKLKTETEHLLFKYFTEEQAEREKLQSLVSDLKSQIHELQRQLEYIQEKKSEPPVKNITEEKALEQVQYETDEEDLAKETEWIRQQSRKKRKLNQSLTPPQQHVLSPSDKDINTTKAKKNLQPPPIIVENIKNYHVFYDSLISCVASDSFLIKTRNGDSVKISAQSDDSYRAITKLLSQNNSHWYSYENKQERPIRVMAKNLHSSCIPARILADLTEKGYNIQNVNNKLNWRTKEPLNMFILSFDKGEDINKIYKIKSILGCKVDIQPHKTSKLIPQCKKVVPSQPVTKGLSFAQITKGTQARPQSQPQHESQLSSNLEEKLNKILSVITSFDDRLKKLEHSSRLTSSKQK